VENDPTSYMIEGEMQVNLVSPPPYQLHRISRTPFVPPRWEFAHKDDEPQPGTFGGRFDDPRKPWGIPDSERFRMFYCARDRICSFIECVQYIKLDPDQHTKTAESLDAFAQRVNSLVPEDSREAPVTRETLDPTTAQAALAAWANQRRIATTYLNNDVTFVDVEGDETLTSLNSIAVLRSLAKKYGHSSITVDAVRDTGRELTQAIAYILYQVAARDGLLHGNVGRSSIPG
jgi:hypothetical protein